MCICGEQSGIFFQWLFHPIQDPGLLFSSVIIYSQTVGLLGRVISTSQGPYLNAGQHKQNKRIHTPNIHSLCGIRTHDPSGRASEDSSYPRPRSYCDRLNKVPLGQVFSEYFGFPCQFSFHRLLHIHLSSEAGTIGQLGTDVPSGHSLAPPDERKKKKKKN
jgi:hypothetical protein